MTPRGRLVVIGAAGLLPWIVVWAGLDGGIGLVFSFGLVIPDPLHVTTLSAYLLIYTRGLPETLLAWPIATLLWAVALVSGLAGVTIDREDGRLTGGSLVFAGASLLAVAVAVGRPTNVTAVPVGTVALWAVAWWGYRDDLVRMWRPAGPRER